MEMEIPIEVTEVFDELKDYLYTSGTDKVSDFTT